MRRLQCPYHAWTYGFDGSLRNAPFTDGLEDFDPTCFGAARRSASRSSRASCCSTSPARRRRRTTHVGDLAPLARRATASPSCGARARIVYDVDANWKAIAENYSECLHCPGVHPELNRLSHYLSGETIEGAGAWCGGSMTLAEGVETMAADGARTAARRSTGVDDRARSCTS